MRNILILGSGAGGTIVANMLRKELPESEWHITIIDREEQHHYQAGYLSVPFGIYSQADILKPKKEFIPPGVEFVLDTILSIDREARRVTTQAGGYNYDWYFAANGVRDQVKIELVTPLDNVFTKPVAAKTLAEVAVRKNIRVTPLFDLAQVNAQEKTIESHRGEKVGYDLLVAIPPNMGDQCLIDSGLSDPVGFVPTDNHTLKVENSERIYALGDTTNVPTSKAGSVAHYMAYTLVENLVREIDGHSPRPKFDGHATCFLASGFEKAILKEVTAVSEKSQILERLAGILKKLTTPEALDLMNRAADLPARLDLDQAGPLGPREMLAAIKDPELRQGLGVVLALTRSLTALKG